jgi:hypothetical protein
MIAARHTGGATVSFATWLNDWRWAANVKRARAYRRSLGFAQRIAFDRALRHPVSSGHVIEYPDAFYYVTIDDLCAAMLKAMETK